MGKFETLNINDIKLENRRIKEVERVRDNFLRLRELERNPPRTRSWGESNFELFEEKILPKPNWFKFGF